MQYKSNTQQLVTVKIFRSTIKHLSLSRRLLPNFRTMSIPAKQTAVLIDGVSEGYDVIKHHQIDTPKIESPKDIIVKNQYAGVNFIEAYFRKGYYPVPFPYTLGREASGVVAEVGSEVTDFKVGDKVCYVSGGAFSEYVKVPETNFNIKKLPSDISEDDFKVAGSMLIQCATAYTFTEEPYQPKKGEYALVWAAAGGVGQIMTQLLSQRGVNVIGLASSKDKLDLVKSLGAAHTINYKTEDVVAKVKEITNGKGAKISYDSVGQATWEISLGSLGVGGILLSYGNSSGKVPPVSIYSLTPKNNMILRPNCYTYIQDRATFEYYFERFFGDYKSGKVKHTVPKEYPLSEYVDVAKTLESGTTTGKFVLKI